MMKMSLQPILKNIKILQVTSYIKECDFYHKIFIDALIDSTVEKRVQAAILTLLSDFGGFQTSLTGLTIMKNNTIKGHPSSWMS